MSLPRKVLEKYVKDGCAFIETGSRWGDTLIRAMETGGAYCAFGCEVDGLYAGVAKMHVADYSNKISVDHQDSVTWLRGFVERKGNVGSVVFLDAHTETRTPVISELNVIHSWEVRPRAILIDDIKLMEGWGVDYTLLFKMLMDMGYRVHYEDGARPEDIMVGVMP